MIDFENLKYTRHNSVYGWDTTEETPLYVDPLDEWIAHYTVIRRPDGRCYPMLHLLFRDWKMTPQRYKRFRDAIPAIKRAAGHPLYCIFESDNDARHRFALKCGWTYICDIPVTCGGTRRCYYMHIARPQLVWDGGSALKLVYKD